MAKDTAASPCPFRRECPKKKGVGRYLEQKMCETAGHTACGHFQHETSHVSATQPTVVAVASTKPPPTNGPIAHKQPDPGLRMARPPVQPANPLAKKPQSPG